MVHDRYTTKRAVLNVSEMVARTGVTRHEVAEAVGLSDSQFSQKIHSLRNQFSLEEFGRIAEFFSRKLGKPLTGWPFYDERFSDLVDSCLSSLAKKK